MVKKIFLFVCVLFCLGSVIVTVILLKNEADAIRKIVLNRITYGEKWYNDILGARIKNVVFISFLELAVVTSTCYCIVLYFRTPLKVATEDYRARREARRAERQEKKRQRLQEELERMSREHE